MLGALAITACEPVIQVEHKPTLSYNFGSISAEATENSATITTDIPYLEVDGVRYEAATFTLGYCEATSGLLFNDQTIVEEYSTKDGKAIFTLEGLKPATAYAVRLTIESEYGSATSDETTFTTAEHTPVCTIECRSEVETKGLMATVELSDVAYMVDGQNSDIATVTLEYARLSSEEWIALEFNGAEIDNGSLSIDLPATGGDYLEENRDYRYRVTISPANEAYQTITTAVEQFKTKYAEVTAYISKPELRLSDRELSIDVENVKVYYDGIELPDYHYCDYFIYYRKAGSTDWQEELTAEATESGMRLTLDSSLFDEGSQYEFAAVVVAGAEQKVRLSDIASIEIPEEEIPTPPTPPTPPIEGGDDTTELAGEWQLTEWRGAEPSFDVYMSISEDGIITLWQRIDSREWEVYYSVVNYDGGVIHGQYSDNVAWGASYNVTITGEEMQWVDTADSSDISVYTRCTLPDFSQTATTRSSAPRTRFL